MSRITAFFKIDSQIINNPVFSRLLVWIPLFVLYLTFSCRDIYWGDSVEFVYVAKTFGIAHPSGYPLYSLLIGFISLVGIPEAWGLSILSGFFAVFAMYMLYRILVLLGISRLSASFTVVFLGLGKSLVSQAIIPEIYTLHLLLQFCIIYYIILWGADKDESQWKFLWLFIGLGFSNHLMTILLAPSIFILLFTKRKHLKSKQIWLTALKYFALGLLPYLYMFIRANTNPMWNYGDPSGIFSFLSHVSGDIFRYRLFSLDSAEIQDQILLWWQSLENQWTWFLLVFVLFGVFFTYRRIGRTIFLAGAIWLVISLIYLWNYMIPDKDGYYLVSHTLIGILMCSGFGGIVRSITFWLPNNWSELFSRVMVLPVIFMLFVWISDDSQSKNTSLSDFTYDAWRHLDDKTMLITENLSLNYSTLAMQDEGLLPADFIVISEYLLGFAWYHEFIKKRYPDVILPSSFPKYAEYFVKASDEDDGYTIGRLRSDIVHTMTLSLIEANIKSRPVALFLSDASDGIDDKYGDYYLQNRGVVYKVSDKPFATKEKHYCAFSSKYMMGKTFFSDLHERYLASRYATSCNRLAISYVSDGRYQDALYTVNKALRYDPEYLQAMKNKGLILVKYLKNVEYGRQIWQNYVELAGFEADKGVVKWLKENP